jgi:hypothetical protein
VPVAAYLTPNVIPWRAYRAAPYPINVSSTFAQDEIVQLFAAVRVRDEMLSVTLIQPDVIEMELYAGAEVGMYKVRIPIPSMTVHMVVDDSGVESSSP